MDERTDNDWGVKWTDVDWTIGREGRAWSHEEFFQRLEIGPEKMEAVKGKLFWNDNERMLMIGMMLENLGIDKALRLGDPELWRQAIAELDQET